MLGAWTHQDRRLVLPLSYLDTFTILAETGTERRGNLDQFLSTFTV
jgi:hypothetical protein